MTWRPKSRPSAGEWIEWLSDAEQKDLRLHQLALAHARAEASRIKTEIQTLRVRAASRRNRHKANPPPRDRQ